MSTVVDFLLNTWGGYAFALVIILAIWGLAALFVSATFYFVGWWNYRKYLTSRGKNKILAWKPKPEDDAAYLQFQSELKRRR